MATLTESRLRTIINEELGQDDRSGPLRRLKAHLEGAKQALSELYQGSQTAKASDQAHMMLGGIDKLVKALSTMPELTGGQAKRR